MGLFEPCTETATLLRPSLLVKAARHAARHYRRARGLPRAGAPAGSDRAMLDRLRETERNWEELRRRTAPAYRPTLHVQVLAAYLAEADAAEAQTKASGSAALRRAM